MSALTIDWNYIIHHPDENGITIFISGFLLTLSIYHFLLYFQHKDRSYLYYSLYAFLIFTFVFYRAEHFFLKDFTNSYKAVFVFFHTPMQWLFNTVYLLFVKTFIDLKKYQPKWNRFLNISIISYILLLIVLVFLAKITGNTSFINKAYAYFFLPSISLIAIMTMYILYTMDTVLKYYVLIGSIIYLFLALIAFYLSFTHHSFVILFYIATFFENIFFTLGLGAKQKKILIDKNVAQEKVIMKHKENIELQDKIKTKLDKEILQKTNEIITLTKHHEEQEKRKLAAEFSKRTLDLRMKSLQTQMNPHFLFNALNSVKHFIILNKKEDAAFFLSKLSRLLRKILDNSQLQEINLDEEIQVMKLYIEVENMRMEHKIDFNILIEPNINVNQIKIPPLVLQPFIENAIWHGLALIKENKKITIEISKQPEYLIICIEDNGIGREKSAIINAAKIIKKESLGINLTKQRLESYTQHLTNKVSIRYEDLYKDNAASGTKVFINIPLR